MEFFFGTGYEWIPASLQQPSHHLYKRYSKKVKSAFDLEVFYKNDNIEKKIQLQCDIDTIIPAAPGVMILES